MNTILATVFIVFLGLAALGAIWAFVYSILQQRKYDTAALPDLGDSDVIVEEIQYYDDSEYIPESRFLSEDEGEEKELFEDEETQELLRTFSKVSSEESPKQNSTKRIRFRKEKKRKHRKTDGEND